MTDTDLYQELAASIGLPNSTLVADMFRGLADENQAKVLAAAAPPATIAELAQKTGLAADEIERMIEPLFKKGLLFKSKKPEGTRYYRVRQFMQFHDSAAVALDVPQKVLDLLNEFMHTEWVGYFDRVKSMMPRPAMRVIPVNVAIEPDTQILVFDDVKNHIENAERIAVTRCSCRVIDGSCGKPVEVCIQLDKAADYAIERGTGRELTKEGALVLLKEAEEAGLVHTGSNSRSVGHVICNCCQDCCMAWAPAVRSGARKFVAPSRFVAAVDADVCTSCETCLDRCFFDAIRLTGENDTAEVSAEACMGCGLCLVTCPSGALSLKETRPEEHVPVK
jgi:ferredoxin/predicted transcriptional regulator